MPIALELGYASHNVSSGNTKSHRESHVLPLRRGTPQGHATTRDACKPPQTEIPPIPKSEPPSPASPRVILRAFSPRTYACAHSVVARQYLSPTSTLSQASAPQRCRSELPGYVPAAMDLLLRALARTSPWRRTQRVCGAINEELLHETYVRDVAVPYHDHNPERLRGR